MNNIGSKKRNNLCCNGFFCPLGFHSLPALCCSSAAVESPTSQTGLKSIMPPEFQTPAAWSTATTVDWTTQGHGGQR